MKILVIGSEGFIGTYARNYYSDRGNELFGCDIIRNEPLTTSRRYYKVDEAEPNYDDLFRSNNFDLCINASGSANVAFSIANIHKDFVLNAQNVSVILEAIRKYNPGCKFINFSSAAVYGNPSSLPVRESDAIEPISPYGFHKYQSELICKEFYSLYNINTCSLRVFSAYGDGLKKQLFWDIYQKSMKSKTIELYGTGKESRDYIYIADLMQALDKIIEKDSFDGSVINVSSGIETTINEAANTFMSYFGKAYKVVFNGMEKAGDPKNWKADIRILSSFGFTPEYSMNKGLEHYFLWLQKQAK